MVPTGEHQMNAVQLYDIAMAGRHGPNSARATEMAEFVTFAHEVMSGVESR